MKKCNHCKQILDYEHFYNSRAEKDGKSRRCKKCCQAYYLADLEKNRTRSRDRYRNNIDQVKSRAKAYGLKNRRHITAYQRHYLYGVTDEQFQQMVKDQSNLCAACGLSERVKSKQGVTMPLSVDHNHATKEVRGLLCRRCNSVLGLAGDSKNVLTKLISYLEKYDGSRNQ